MRYLITGNLGYIGPILCDYIKRNDKDAFIIGYDTGYFLNCAISPKLPKNKPNLDLQVYGDVRYKSKIDCYLEGVDHVIQLAAISNDPMGNEFEKATIDINQLSSLYLARKCIELDIKSFTFASSCSVYGAGSDKPRTEKDLTNPLTAYARSKICTEKELKNLRNLGNTKITCLRFATACGYSPNLRLDLVLNDFVATALTTNSIKILSDGSPWRPVIHIQDLCKAFIAGIEAPKTLVSGQSFNVGIKNGNYTVKELAEVAKSVVPGSELVFLNQHTDPRTYKVSFEKILTILKDYFNPEWSLYKGGKELVGFFKDINFSEKDFRNEKFNRLKKLEKMIFEKKINNKLEWI